MLDLIKKTLKEKPEASLLFKKNLVKNLLQLKVLSFIYTNSKYQELVFYGGSCLVHCYDLPRLSEDLDFVDIKRKVNLKGLAQDLKVFFEKKQSLKVLPKIQKFRIYLKFPILKELSLAKEGESDFLLLKIEIFKEFDFCKDYKIEIVPLFKFGEAVLVRTFDLSTLMATKIRAVLYRRWKKKDKKGRVLVKVKGRDYYDLMWYLSKGVKPNFNCIGGKTAPESLKSKLIEAIKKIDPKSIKLDLGALLEDPLLVEDLGKNLKKILLTLLEKQKFNIR